MISLFTHQKNKNVLYTCEDSLTSSVFDLMKFLPDDLFIRILKNSLFQNKLPINLGNLLYMSFWDKWDATNTTNTNYVEPDVFMRFENIDIILEAKRYDNNQQNPDQMKNELIAYCNEFFSEQKELIFIQVGGIYSTENEEDFILNNFENNKVKICKTNWTKLLDTIVYFKNENENFNNNDRHIISIFNDIISAFELHQFYKLKWLSEMNTVYINKVDLSKFDYSKNKNRKWLKNIIISEPLNDNLNKLFYYARN